MIGQTIAGYEVLGELGAGGMGVVYKARHHRLQRLVALKLLPPEQVADESCRSRFLQEARAASALNHPGIVTIHDIVTHDGADVIVMELIEGEPLDRRIPAGGLPWREAAALAIELAEAMAVAHAAGIVHRDLKPANVMVTAGGRGDQPSRGRTARGRLEGGAGRDRRGRHPEDSGATAARRRFRPCSDGASPAVARLGGEAPGAGDPDGGWPPAEAIDKLQQAIARTDGCVLRGSPDGSSSWAIASGRPPQRSAAASISSRLRGFDLSAGVLAR